jgi:hypothetical protein
VRRVFWRFNLIQLGERNYHIKSTTITTTTTTTTITKSTVDTATTTKKSSRRTHIPDLVFVYQIIMVKRNRLLSRFSVLHSPSSTSTSSSKLRTLRLERRDLSRRLHEAERRIEQVEHQRDVAIATIKEKEQEQEEKEVLYVDGMEIWQNIWHQEDTSAVLKFPTNKSVMCESVESAHSLSQMPGVHTLGVIDKGKTTQSMWIKGWGYTLAGLVSSDEEKQHVRRRAGGDWNKLPYMTTVYNGINEDDGVVVTIEIDMVERDAKLFVSEKGDSKLLKPHTVWTDLPDNVWVAFAFKRNSAREAVLMPCSHWNVTADV